MDFMKSKKTYVVALFVIMCILINYAGKAFATNCNLPLWLDSIGTVLSAYFLGPICGAIIGLTNNIIYGMHDSIAIIYGLTSVAIGLLVGYFAKRKFLDSLFQTTSLSVLITIVSVAISTTLNIIFYNGMTGNIWGDGVIEYLNEQNYLRIGSYIVGEFYIDFLDKLLSLWVLYLFIRLVRHVKKTKITKDIMKLTSLIVILSILCSTATVSAQSDDERKFASYVQTIYNSDKLLPCGEANAIEQTNDGILWIGTYAGLYRFSGSDMHLMDEYESVKNVNCLYADEEGRLWIGTNDNGVSICINENISNSIGQEQGLPSNSVRSIVQGADSYYYIGTSDNMQVLSLNGGLEMVCDIDIKYASSVTADNTGYVAAVSSKGELFLTKNQQIIENQTLDLNGEQFTSCVFDESGVLYVGTSLNHIYTYNVESGQLINEDILTCDALTNINYIYFSEQGMTYVCADNGIGYFNDNKEYKGINTNGFNNSIDDMLVDYQGNMWFTSSRMGVLRLCGSSFIDIYGAAGMEDKVVNSVENWNNNLYVGTDTGLDIINIDNYEKIDDDLVRQLNGVRIRCIKADSSGNLWICTYGNGLWKVSDSEVIKYNSQNDTFCDRTRVVFETKDKTIVAAGESGIIFIRDGHVVKSISIGDGLSNTMILSLMEMQDGTILAGTDGAGIAVIKNQEVVAKITKGNGLSSDVILRTVQDKNGDGAFVVTSNGLCYLSSDTSAIQLSNFPYFNNYDIWQSSDGKIFALSSAGIYVVDRNNLLDGKELDYELLDRKSGLTGAITANSWNYCKDDRYLYISCDSGVYEIDMESDGVKSRSYRMMIPRVKVDDISYMVERGTPLSIPRNANKLEIFPEIVNYSIDDPYVCYYLEGVDKTKTIIPQSELTSIVYTNLPSGTYSFYFSILDKTKTYVLEEGVYTFQKEKEIYDNRWFMIYMLAVLIMAVAWLTWFVVRTQIQRTITLQKRELNLAKNKIEMVNQTILAIAKTVDAKDENTSHHSQRVSEYSVMIAREFGMSDDECENLRKIALLHDIGKIGIADKVLNKTSRLSDEEYSIMKSHVVKGAEILKDFTLVDNVWEGALYHHERYDGKGYVTGLKGEEIPLNARIIGLADAFDAMTANRVYRPRLEFSVVLEEIKNGKGTQFDPKCVDILLKLIDEGKISPKDIYKDDNN